MRTTGEILDTYEARTLWKMLAEAAWACADPGVQYDTTINDWHTCIETDRIRASNPCSEFMFLDDTACNLASLNLVKFLRQDGSFDVEAYRRACRIFIIAQEILVDLSSYPTDRIAERSHEYRPLGLGYANLGTLLMLKGIPYDSDEGRAWAGALTAIMCGHAYAVSAEEAAILGPFQGYALNREAMLKVIGKHRDASRTIDEAKAPRELVAGRARGLGSALELGKQHGFRNSQVTVLAPTGTIGLLMDCDTTGVEPDFALVKFKKLAGGGYFKIVNSSVPAALRNLGYGEKQIKDIIRYLLGTMNLEGTPHVNREWLKAKGLHRRRDRQDRKGASGHFRAHERVQPLQPRRRGCSSAWACPQAEFEKPTFNFLSWAGLTEAQLAEANEAICGTMTVEGAPHLREEHLAVFDCANKCGAEGQALHRADGPCADDGRHAAVPFGRDFEDGQPSERDDGRRSRRHLLPGLEAGPEGHRALPRRLQALAAALDEGGY